MGKQHTAFAYTHDVCLCMNVKHGQRYNVELCSRIAVQPELQAASYAKQATHRVLKWSESDGTAVERQALEGQVTLVLESTTLCSPLCSCQIPTVPYDTLMPSG